MTPLKVHATSALPGSVKLAATLMVAYGLTVVVNAIVQQSINGWEYWQVFPRALLRCGGAVLVAYGLMRRARWAWLLAVIAGGVVVLLAVLGLIVFVTGVAMVGIVMPISQLVGAVVGFLLLSGVVIALLQPQSRALFRARAG